MESFVIILFNSSGDTLIHIITSHIHKHSYTPRARAHSNAHTYAHAHTPLFVHY